jgi:hypothetical protein
MLSSYPVRLPEKAKIARSGSDNVIEQFKVL